MKKTVLSSLVLILLAVAISLISTACKNTSDSTNSNNTSSVSSTSSQEPLKIESGMLTRVYEEVISEMYGEEEPVQVKLESQEQIEEMLGLKADLIKEHYISLPAMNVKVDTFIGIESTEGNAAEVERILNEYKSTVIKDRTEFPYLHDHLPKAKAAQVVCYGDYVFYISLGDSSKIEGDIPEEDYQKKIDANVQKAVDIVEKVLLVK